MNRLLPTRNVSNTKCALAPVLHTLRFWCFLKASWFSGITWNRLFSQAAQSSCAKRFHLGCCCLKLAGEREAGGSWAPPGPITQQCVGTWHCSVAPLCSPNPSCFAHSDIKGDVTKEKQSKNNNSYRKLKKNQEKTVSKMLVTPGLFHYSYAVSYRIWEGGAVGRNTSRGLKTSRKKYKFVIESYSSTSKHLQSLKRIYIWAEGNLGNGQLWEM